MNDTKSACSDTGMVTDLPTDKFDFSDTAVGGVWDLIKEGFDVFHDTEETGKHLAEINDVSNDVCNQCVKECQEVAVKDFSPENIREWYELSADGRWDKITEFAAHIGEAMGINFKGVSDDMSDNPDAFGYTNGRDGIIHLNRALLIADPGQIFRAIDTCAHECEHIRQYEAIHDPEKFGIDEKTRKAYEVAWANYNPCLPSYYDPIGYSYNTCEVDSRRVGEAVAGAAAEKFTAYIQSIKDSMNERPEMNAKSAVAAAVASLEATREFSDVKSSSCSDCRGSCSSSCSGSPKCYHLQ